MAVPTAAESAKLLERAPPRAAGSRWAASRYLSVREFMNVGAKFSTGYCSTSTKFKYGTSLGQVRLKFLNNEKTNDRDSDFLKNVLVPWYAIFQTLYEYH